MEKLIRPRNGKKLLPPATSNISNVETKDEGERDHIKECIEVFDYALKQRSLIIIHELSIDDTKSDVDNKEEEQFSEDELVQGALPLEQESGEAASR